MLEIKVNMITTWDIRCGIAEYSRLLLNELNKYSYINVNVCPIKNPASINPFHHIKLARKAGACRIVHIQYQPGIFGHIPLPRLWFSYFFLLISILKLCNKNRIIVTAHEFDAVSITGRLMLRFLNLSDRLIVHAENLAECLTKNGISKNKITIIPHGTTKAKILDKRECKKRLGVSNEKVLTIFGFVHENKGHDLLIKILPKIDKNVVLLIAGGPHPQVKEDYYHSLKKLASDLDVQERVRFLGFINEEKLPIIFNATDIAVFPYRWIQVSGALHSILNYKVPTIASDLDYFREIKNKYDCIELFRREDEQDLLAKVEELLNNEEKRQYLAEKCEILSERTTWKEVAERTVELYLELSAGHPNSLYEDRAQRERLEWLKLRARGTVLEAGCATGFVANYVGADVGIDLREDRVLLAATKYPHIQFILGDASELPFSDDAFDTVLAPELLEHVPFDIAKKVLMECVRVCKDKVLVTMPNASKSEYKNNSTIGGRNPEHLWAPTREKVEELFGDSDYQLECSSDGYFWLATIIKSRVNRK